MNVQTFKTRTFLEGEDLLSFLTTNIQKIPEGAVIVVASKIVALAEKRTAVITNSKTREALIRKESDIQVKTKHVWLTVKDGMVLPSAGIDESNANGKLILLPKDSFRSASLIRKHLKKHYGVKNLGVIITDSSVTPLRAGVVGIALGYAGFRGLKDYRGKRDIYGRKLTFSSTNIADSLATAAILLMGEGNEKQPLAIIQGAPVMFCERVNQSELRIALKDDMFQPLIKNLKKA